MNSNYRQVLNRASAICSRSEKCKADITPVLEKAGLSSEEVDQALEYLVKEKFIDEERYTHNFVHDKFYLNKWGKYKIAYQLKMKKIHQEIISGSLLEISAEEYEKTLLKLLRSKAKTIHCTSNTELKSKLMVFAQGRGYESELAYRLANKIAGSSEGE